MIEVSAGSVQGAGEIALSNRTPSRTRRSMFGVATPPDPLWADTAEALKVSIVIRTTWWISWSARRGPVGSGINSCRVAGAATVTTKTNATRTLATLPAVASPEAGMEPSAPCARCPIRERQR